MKKLKKNQFVLNIKTNTLLKIVALLLSKKQIDVFWNHLFSRVFHI